MSMMRVGSGVVLFLALAGPALPQEDSASRREDEATRLSRCARLLRAPSPSPKALLLCGIGVGGGAAKGDFNGDGYADLAIGVPYEDGTTYRPDAGMVNILYGEASGLTATADQTLIGTDAYSHFGWSLASGDFNGDGYSDLAVGAPDPSPHGLGGYVSVFYGSSRGLVPTPQELVYQITLLEQFYRFGAALVWGDFNGDGFADLAVGAPNTTVIKDLLCVPVFYPVVGNSTPDAGAVSVYFGGTGGLFYPSATLIQGDCPSLIRPDQVGDTRSGGDRFGSVLTALRSGLRDSLVVGVPSENKRDFFGSTVAADTGLIHIIGFDSSGSVNDRRTISQSTSGVSGAAEEGDNFGYALATGDFAGDGTADLAVSSPYEDLTDASGVAHPNAGAVQIFPNGGVTGNRFLHEGSLAGGAIQSYAHFGFSLAAGDFDGDGKKDLAIGVPGENIGSVVDAGLVRVLYGVSASGLSTTRVQTWHQDVAGIQNLAEAGDQFGFSLSAWNFGKDSAADLAIGVPYEDVVASDGDGAEKHDAGAVHVLYGVIGTGLTATGNQFWHQDVPDVDDSVEPDDHFGWALY